MGRHTYHIETVQSWLLLTRLHILIHLVAVVSICYYRISHLLHQPPTAPWILITLAELLLSVIWFLNQSFRWHPVSRTVMTDKLPREDNFPGLDIFVCTLDPEKEPTVQVMDTVVSAVAMDYPSDKLAVYLSDDGGTPVTLYAMKEAGVFAKEWVPFCRKYGVKSRCPRAFFSPMGEDEDLLRHEGFKAHRDLIKAKYEKMQKNIDKFGSDPNNLRLVNDRAPRIEIINEEAGLPLLVYVSRERRPSLPHKFKGGALNTLLRVSGFLSNAPYFLVVDCDMYCNDPTSAKQAMCFFLDPQTSKDTAFVQFPQMFHNLSKKDIYDSQTRTAFKTMWQGMDGLRGPGLSGSGNYLSRSALLFGSPNQKNDYLQEAQKYFGNSTGFIESLKIIRGQKTTKKSSSREETLKEALAVCSCSYENNTKWGSEVGFSYVILLESTVTGYILHTRGWRSVYLYPKTPCFLGCAPTDIKEGMIQLVKWLSELLLLGFSKHSPFTYGFSSMSIIHSFTYCLITMSSLYAFFFILYGIVPQLCLLKGIPVFPKVTDPWFAVFAFVYVSTQVQHLVEVLSGEGSIEMWWDEQRIWILKSVTSIFAVLEATKKRLGLNKMKFNLSNKAIDEEKMKKYEEGRFDFQGAAVFMAPMVLLLIINIVGFFGGIWRVLNEKDFQEMFGQLFLVTYVMALSYPILQAIVTMKSKSG
ncbi:cellulose synthase-like protein G2 [Vigna umbellata]|uniref:cellulose synthase-like protein G2 n=1 Tax=Vigna umbellata TaxID=87088 RepID=UPI001F5F3BB6|nr:cellulose synthase-like protein G2 [Vigna umbellata]